VNYFVCQVSLRDGAQFMRYHRKPSRDILSSLTPLAIGRLKQLQIAMRRFITDNVNKNEQK